MLKLLLIFSLSLPALSQPQSLPDEVQRGFKETGTWDVRKGGYYGEYRVSDPAVGQQAKKSVTWTIMIPDTNRYFRVQATWTADGANASNAKYTIYDGKKLLGNVSVNQKKVPRGEPSNGVMFQDLGSFHFQSDKVKVELTNEGDGKIIADSIRVK